MPPMLPGRSPPGAELLRAASYECRPTVGSEYACSGCLAPFQRARAPDGPHDAPDLLDRGRHGRAQLCRNAGCELINHLLLHDTLVFHTTLRCLGMTLYFRM